MKIGCDTGFFLKLLDGHETALEVWELVVDNNAQCIVSCVTLFELHRLALLGKIDLQGAKIILGAISGVCKVFWCDSQEKLMLASKLSVDTSLSIIQSVIMMSFTFSKVTTIYTTDPSLKTEDPAIKIIYL